MYKNYKFSNWGTPIVYLVDNIIVWMLFKLETEKRNLSFISLSKFNSSRSVFGFYSIWAFIMLYSTPSFLYKLFASSIRSTSFSKKLVGWQKGQLMNMLLVTERTWKKIFLTVISSRLLFVTFIDVVVSVRILLWLFKIRYYRVRINFFSALWTKLSEQNTFIGTKCQNIWFLFNVYKKCI